jgi:hypothetical protein
MKKLLKVIFFISITFLLTLPMNTLQTTYAATIKLNKSSITLDEGKSYSLRLDGTSNTPKWSSNNKEVAKISVDGKITAVKAGVATITASLNSKKYTCKVTVKDVLTSEEASANIILYEAAEVDENLIVVLQNNNNIDLMVEVNVTFFDDNENMLSTEDQYVKTMKAGGKSVFTFDYPYDSNYDKVEYSRFEVTPSVDLENPLFKLRSYANDIAIDSNIGANGILAKVTNSSDNFLDCIELSVLFLQDDIIVGSEQESVYDLKPDKSENIEFRIPYDQEYNHISFDNYIIIVNEAYTYSN